MLRNFIIFISVLSCSVMAHADYNFNHFSIGATSITDDSLGPEIDASSLSYNLSYEMGSKFLLGGGISITSYDETTINGVYIDARASGGEIFLGKYIDLDRGKLVGYLGMRTNKTEIVVDTLRGDTDDTGLVGSFGFILPLSDRFDFLLGLGVDTLYDETDTSISIGGSFDLADMVSFEASYYSADEVDALTLEVRFNYL